MFGFLAPVRAEVVRACLLLAVWVACEVLAVRLTAQAIDVIEAVRVAPGETRAGWLAWLGAPSAQAGRVEWAVFWLALITLIMAVLSFLRELANARLSMFKVFHIRAAVFDRLQQVGLAFHDRISTGELINRALTDLQNVRLFVQSAVLMTLEIALIVGGYLILLATRSPWLVLFALAPLPAWVWYVVRFSRKVQPAQQAIMEAGDENVALIAENISGVQVVRAFAAEAHEIEKYRRSTDRFFERTLARIRLYADFTPVIRSISMASHLMLFLVAGILIIKGVLAAGDILMLGAAMGAILGRLQQVAQINEQYQNAVVSARRLQEVLTARATVPEAAGAASLPPGLGAVRFEHVTFGYDPAEPILRDVTFDAPGGSVVALVGPTGAGKSTLVQLLARLYDPQAGRILIDGCDLRAVSLAEIRRQVAFVFQETFLFSDTIAANIAYGRPQLHEGDVEAAARLSQAHEFVDPLPARYESMLGERGQNLSGGQRQRLAIARAIAANPRILILDDAMAAVDSETEDLILRGLRHVMTGKTVFVIAHRLHTVKDADLVLVLEEGRITQIGRHEQLLKQEGHYREIAAVQLHPEEEEQVKS